MKIIETELEGVFIIESFHATDDRGSFTKTFSKDFFQDNRLLVDFEESYFSVSKQNVIRGMHFQLPPHAHEKFVYVAKGEVLDVILDLRKESISYGKAISIILNESNQRSVYIPKGLAHGFKSMRDDTTMIYNVSTVYNSRSDFGIRYNSFNFNWEVDNPIISDRDKALITFEMFKESNPF